MSQVEVSSNFNFFYIQTICRKSEPITGVPVQQHSGVNLHVFSLNFFFFLQFNTKNERLMNVITINPSFYRLACGICF